MMARRAGLLAVWLAVWLAVVASVFAQTSPVTLGDVSLFDIVSYKPNNLFAYPSAGIPGKIGVYDSTTSFTAGFTAPNGLSSNLTWFFPAADAAGCLASDGFFHLSFVSCGGGGGGGGTGGTAGPFNSIQYNNAGVFGGDSNLTWNPGTRQMSISGTAGQYTVFVNGGWMQSNGGFVSNLNNYQGYNTATDGAVLRGISVLPAVSNVTGGYINFGPLGYGNQPVTLPGQSAFAAHSGLLWLSGTNASTADTTFGLNTNVYINAAGGFATLNTPMNSVQAPNGGMLAKSYTATAYIQTGHSSGPPTLTAGDGFSAGAQYFDDVIGGEQVYNGTAWVGMGGGGGAGNPGGPVTTPPVMTIQFNNGGVFGGSTNLEWNNTLRLVTVTTADAAHAGVAVGNGFMQADAGFLATGSTATRFDSVQAPGGGMFALSFTALNYTQVGNSANAPTATPSDGFHAGALYWDCGGAPCVDGVATGSMKGWNGAAWISLGGGTGSPGGTSVGSVGSVQYNSSSSFGGDTHFTWDSTNRLMVVTTASAATAGIAVANGSMQADNGFLATGSTALNFNAIQAPGGGMAAKSFTATKYIQIGSGTTNPSVTLADGFGPGAMYYNTVSSCVDVYNGTSFNCVGSGGSGTVALPQNSVQFNNAGNFGGSNNFTWSNGTQLLTVNAIPGTAGIAVGGGFIQSLQGFLVPAGGASNFNSFQSAASGGMSARSFTATSYVQTGNNISGTTTPTVTTADGYHRGAMYFNVGLGTEQLCTAEPCSVGTPGTGWVSLATSTGGVSSLNFLTGALSVVGTPNQVIVFPSTPNITLSLPQNINSTANVIFATAQTLTFTSTQTGTGSGSPSFQTSNGKFSVDGAGNISVTGTIALNGGAGTGLNVTGNSAVNSIQTIGGINVGSSGSSNGVYEIVGNVVINNSRAFVGSGGVNTTGTGTFGAALTANGGITMPTSVTSQVVIGAGGNLYVSPRGSIGSCSGIGDGWFAINTATHKIEACIGGANWSAQLVAGI